MEEVNIELDKGKIQKIDREIAAIMVLYRRIRNKGNLKSI